MAHYCVFCDQSFDSFTQLRYHKCEQVARDCVQLIDSDSEEEKENWTTAHFALDDSTASSTTSDKMEEDYSNIKSEYEYTVELNDGVGSDIVNSPSLHRMLHGKSGVEIGSREEAAEKIAHGVKPEMSGDDDYVYVLEPDDSISMNHDNEDKSNGINNQKNFNNNRVTSEHSGVIDLSCLNKRKRKSNLDSALSNILKTKAVCMDQTTGGRLNESLSDDIQANKIHVIEGKEPKNVIENKLQTAEVNSHSESVSDEIVKDLSVKAQNKQPIATESTPAAPVPMMNTPNTSSSRKNRRKRSMPVRCEKNEEIGDMNEIMEEYGMQSEIKSHTAVTDLTDKPIDLTPRMKPVEAQGSAKRVVSAAPMDLTSAAKIKAEKAVKSEPLKAEYYQPVDLSKPAFNEAKNSQKSNGRHYEAMSPIAAPFNPVQMRQLFENMYKMQSQFPNQNLVQAQLMQFHALMQNAMLNNSVMQMNNNNANGVKNGKVLKSDKNDNVIKAEPGVPTEAGVPNDHQVNNELQKFSLEFMHKNGMLQNNFPVQFNNISPDPQFSPNQANQFKHRSNKRRSKGPSLLNESSSDSIKPEGTSPLIDFGGRNCPEQVVETLQKYCPIVPLENLPKAQLIDDSNCIRFFVKDNEQIRVIVESLLQVGVLDLDEQKITGTEPVFKYICRVCNQTFFHVEHLTKHVKKYHIVKKYQCSECERSFHDAGNYRQHMRVHDETDIPFECPECKRRFRHKCTLKVHMRIHTGEKPFKCEICNATFKISSGLQTHMRKHTGETPYACEFCDLRFKCQSNLKQHLFQHTQVRPFPCNICGKTYSRKSIRDAHLLTHSKDNMKNEHVKKWIDNLPQHPVAVGGGE